MTISNKNATIYSTFEDFIEVLDARKSFKITELTESGNAIKHFRGEFVEVYKIIEAIKTDRSYKNYKVIAFKAGLVNEIVIQYEKAPY